MCPGRRVVEYLYVCPRLLKFIDVTALIKQGLIPPDVIFSANFEPHRVLKAIINASTGLQSDPVEIFLHFR